ncbi:PREDICTED: NADH dehydrogenase [ubiquinone] 1 beta subcomplex subunit 6-like isoform X3 [Gekko japonicus]|uniref:NADH dehydrogenase [ubiquinone] 1 beta subcomplex subunit 6-like isoform X3 n=1 Tax=Gekko japonicus TaxID=146911 RepID=A0ABM1JUZ3_GEKJA|nr:PREDICTED: NADH dehydrogenase [ubiquinone] 1 beta subcomplex subunit 6-like isoform X3 [Gekko japonicus]
MGASDLNRIWHHHQMALDQMAFRQILVFKTYHAGTFIFFRILIPFWLSQYYVKYHLLILLTTVLLSWGYVIYATRLAAQWQLKDDYPTQTHNFCETLKQGDL